MAFLRRARHPDGTYYGYDVWLPYAIEEWVYEAAGQPRQGGVPQHWIDGLSPPFFAAAWDLCRFGVLRPGPVIQRGQSVGELSGYSVTPAGRLWLLDQAAEPFIPTDGSRTAEILLRAGGMRFGATYRLRAVEAARCYAAGAYYACCAMVGAAAESVVLAVGSAKLGEPAAEKIYFGHSGRSKLEEAILRDVSPWLQKQFRGHTALIALWRDRAAHAHDALVTESEAYMDLRGLLRFATEVTEHWETLTRAPP